MAEPEASHNPHNSLDNLEGTRADPPTGVPQRRSTSSHSPLGRLPVRTPLVGRADELDFLKAEFEAVAAGGGGRVIFISGEPGVGKTRLARELGMYARLRGGRFLEGHYLRDGTAPYGPWVEALRAGLRGLNQEDLCQAVDPYRAKLAPILPELAERLGPFPPPASSSPEEQRRRLYDSVAELIDDLSQRAPLVLLLDDLQWAPGITLLSHVARRLAVSRTLLLGVYRQQEFQEQPALIREWAELNRTRLVTQLAVKPFTEAETGQLVAHYFGQGPAAQLRTPVYRRTRGNAFFVEEVLRSQAESGVVRPGAAGWEVIDPSRVTIPESMKLAVEERVARLGEKARDILTQAAVLGQEFSFPALRALTGQPEDDLIDVIDRAVAARLLIDRTEGSEERFGFLDDQMQELLYDGIPPLRRRRYHLRAGQALEEVYGDRLDGQLEELSRHFTEGQDAVKAADYGSRAAEKNNRLFHWARARQLYERAVAALAHLPDTADTRRRRIDTLVELVRVAWATADPDRSLLWLTQAEALASALGGPGLDDAGGDRGRLAGIQYWRGRAHYLRNEYQAARESSEQALALARAAGEEEVALLASGVMGGVLWYQGYPGRAIPLLAQAAGPLEKTASAWEWVWTAGYLALARAATGDYATGLAEQQRVLTRARATHDPRCLALIYGQLAMMHSLGGNLPAMLEASQAAVRAAEECGDQVYVHLGLGWRMWAESRLGQHAAAQASLAAFQAVTQSLGGRTAYGDWYAAFEADIALNADRVAEAGALAEQAVAHARAVSGIFAEGLAQRVWGQALARTIDREAWTIDHAPHRASPRPPSVVYGPDVEAHLAASLRCFEEGEHRLEAARTHLTWGLLGRDRDPATALAHLQQALAQFEAADLAGERERTRQALHEVSLQVSGPRTAEKEHGSTGYPDGLTPREVDVLRLIAAGRTTKEIAAELVISISTVERHIVNLYGKIGARGRADATAYALSRGLAQASAP